MRMWDEVVRMCMWMTEWMRKGVHLVGQKFYRRHDVVAEALATAAPVASGPVRCVEEVGGGDSERRLEGTNGRMYALRTFAVVGVAVFLLFSMVVVVGKLLRQVRQGFM